VIKYVNRRDDLLLNLALVSDNKILTLKISLRWERSPGCLYRRNMSDKLKELVYKQLTQEMESEGFIMLEWMMDTFALSKTDAIELFLSYIEEKQDVKGEIIVTLKNTEVVRQLLITSSDHLNVLTYHLTIPQDI